MKKIVQIIIVTFILAVLAVPLLGCDSESSGADGIENQVVTVQRGDLTLDITGVGNLALSRTEDLAIDLFYEEGTVEEVLVEEGDTVEEGQVLVKLDTEDWEDELSTLEDQVTVKERDLLQVRINLQTAEQNLKNSQDNQTARELALLNEQIDLRNAEHHLDETRDIYTWPEIEIAQKEVDKWKAYVDYVVEQNLPAATVTYAQARLTAAEAVLDAMINSYDTEEVAIAKLQVEAAEMALAQAEEDLNEVAEDVAIKELQLTLSQGKLEDAQKALIDAHEDLEEARGKSPLIMAPFAGFITKINVEGGDEVLTGTVAVQLADPEKFEADILVSEMDILQVKLGGEAWVQVDAMPEVDLSAKVTHLSPTATIQSGVVNYEVKVEIESFEAAAKEYQEASQEVMQSTIPGELPEHLRQAIEAGQINQEQADEMMKQRQQGQESQEGRVPRIIPEDFQLREGLTVTVSILVAERTDVLLIPSGAITTRGGRAYVQVVPPDGIIEERAIQTGISDWQYTEVSDGLSEGESVVVPQGTTTASTTPPDQPHGIMPIPGMGRPR